MKCPEVPKGILIYGDSQFEKWFKPLVLSIEPGGFSGRCDETIALERAVREIRPRLLVIDVDRSTISETLQAGIVATKAFGWITIACVFDSLNDKSMSLARTTRLRKWSLVRKATIESIGLVRVLAGVFTEHGLRDSSIATYESDTSAQRNNEDQIGADADDDEDAA